MKRFFLLTILLLFFFSFSACSSYECGPSDVLFRKIEKAYGKLAPGLYLDSRAKEWEENYLDSSMIESIFGSEEEYKRSVSNAYLYLSSSFLTYEELMVLECYTGNQALQMASLLSERGRMLAKLEEETLDTQILCQDRYVVYCRLKDQRRAEDAIRTIQE